nr:l-type lectin-domain containing receptor kinase ix.1 [Quercus suber]
MLAVRFIACGFILVGGLAMVLFALWKRNKRDNKEDHALDKEFKRGTGPRRYQGFMGLGCVTTYRVSKESDVYSVGIVALELACERKPINHSAREDQVVMLDWVKVLHERGEVLNATNQRLGGCFDEQKMKCLYILGFWCTHSEHNNRPSIEEVIQLLNFETPLPLLQLDAPGTPRVNEATSFLSTSSDASYSKG